MAPIIFKVSLTEPCVRSSLRRPIKKAAPVFSRLDRCNAPAEIALWSRESDAAASKFPFVSNCAERARFHPANSIFFKRVPRMTSRHLESAMKPAILPREIQIAVFFFFF